MATRKLSGPVAALVVVLAQLPAPVRAQAAPEAPATEFTQREFYQQALAFERRELVEAYQAGGRHDPRWDAPALAALEQFALFCAQDETDDRAFPSLYPGRKITYEQIIESTQKAIDSGCSDPMIEYAQAMARRDKGQSAEARALLGKAAAQLEGSPYSPYRRFKVLEHNREFLSSTSAQENTWPAVEQLCMQMAKGPFLNTAAHREIAEAVFQTYEWRPHAQFESDLGRLAAMPGVDRWVYLNAAVELEIELAWDARGSDWASTVTPEGWRDFNTHLTSATAAAEEAWKAHPELPEPATAMIRVCMGAGNMGDEKKWFERAVAAQADFSHAYDAIFMALEPRWGGSNEAVLAIGKEAAAGARYDTAMPWQFLTAATAVLKDGHGGDPDIFKNLEIQRTASQIIMGYAQQWKGLPPAHYFQSSLAAIKVAGGDAAGARKTFEAISDEPDPAAFGYFGLYLSSGLDQSYFDSYPDQDAIKRFRTAAARGNFQNAIDAIDALVAADKPTGRDAQLIHSFRAGCKLMEDYRGGATIDLMAPASKPLWFTDTPGTFEGTALVNRGIDNRLDMNGRYYLPDRHYELHLKFEFMDAALNQNSGIRLTFGKGTGGRKWFIGMRALTPEIGLGAPGIDDSRLSPAIDAAKHSIDIVYWGGIPQATIDGKAVDFSFADPKAVQGLSRQNTLEFVASGPLRITQMTLHHLNAKPGP